MRAAQAARFLFPAPVFVAAMQLSRYNQAAMAELKQSDSQEPLFSAASEPEPRKWKPFVIGLVLVIVAVGAIAFFSRPDRVPEAPQNPYVARLAISDVAMSKSASFLGAEVTYIDATIINSGDRLVTGVTLQVLFRNMLNEVVGDERLLARVIVPNPLAGYPDLVNMSQVPIEPGKSRNVRLTFEHISADWNQNTPELRILDVQLKDAPRK